MPRKRSARYWAKPELKRRIIELNGGTSGYLHAVRSFIRMSHTESETPTPNYFWKLLHDDKPTPVWLVVELVRLAERDPEMDYDVALERSRSWFAYEEGER